MRKAFIALALCGLLVGCQTDKPIRAMSYSESKALFASLHKKCAEEGAPMGSKNFDACMQQELNAEAYRRHEHRVRRARALKAMGGAMSSMSQYEYSRAAATRHRMVNCTSTPSSTWVGGPVTRVNTTCY